jgi:TctA family transporter
MKNESKSFWILSVLGIIFGYVSFWLNKILLSSIIPLILAVVFLYVFSTILRKALKINEKMKWFMTNGGWVYIFLWFVTWIIFYNL